MFRKNRSLLAWGVGIVWASVTIGGFASLWRYETTACAQQEFGDRWPAGSHILRDAHHFTLVVFMHPQCPCSKASVADLARLMTRCQGRLIAQVLFIRPSGFGPGWEQTDLWRDAAAIPGTFVSCDVDGVEARRFGAMTSGQTALYDSAGRLLFQGGITESRGHEGDNAGCDAIADLVLHEDKTVGISRGETGVFGCSLFETPPATGGRSN
ncbi:MAG TPA: hypothetical protein VGG44_11985 [Tepidisphaeraceae bacterium]|jgi:hypothetical protein